MCGVDNALNIPTHLKLFMSGISMMRCKRVYQLVARNRDNLQINEVIFKQDAGLNDTNWVICEVRERLYSCFVYHTGSLFRNVFHGWWQQRLFSEVSSVKYFLRMQLDKEVSLIFSNTASKSFFFHSIFYCLLFHF